MAWALWGSILIMIGGLIGPNVSEGANGSPMVARRITNAQDLEDAVSGRLGGMRQSFTDAYGAPVETQPGIGDVYALPDVGLFAVQFQPRTEPAEEARAIWITLRSQRPATLPALTPHSADWTIDDALARVWPLLPVDAELAEPIADAGTMSLLIACQSDALATVFETDGGCRVRLVTPTPETVSFALIALGGPEPRSGATPVATPVDPCADVATWAKTTADRVAEAVSLLDAIAALVPDDPGTPEQLRLWATRFAAMAADQRGESPPSAASRANRLLADAFAAYAAALDEAAAALVANDEAAMERATTMLSSANADLTRGDAALTQALTRCGVLDAQETASIGHLQIVRFVYDDIVPAGCPIDHRMSVAPCA